MSCAGEKQTKLNINKCRINMSHSSAVIHESTCVLLPAPDKNERNHLIEIMHILISHL